MPDALLNTSWIATHRPCEPADLPARLVASDPRAMHELIDLYGDRLARLVQRLTAYEREIDVEDLVQDVFARAWQYAPQYRGDASVWTWLVRIAINRCRTVHRRRVLRRRALQWLGREANGAHETTALARLAPCESACRIRAAIAALPLKLREPCVLVYLQQMDAPQAAEALGVSVNVIHVRLHRARSRLRSQLGDLNRRPL